MGNLERLKKWKGRKVFVTGADGFVGSWLTKWLVENGADVVVLIISKAPRSPLLSSKNIYSRLEQVISGSFTEYSTVENIFNEFEVDSCFHLGAQAIVGAADKSPLSTFETNIKGTWNVLEAARNSETLKRMVVASSDKAYGEHDKLPYSEEHSLNALHPYDASKACTDILARTYYHTYGLPVAVTRCANIYGGGDLNFSRIIPDTIQSILQDKNPIIRSDGTPVRDYLYIQDAVNAYLELAEQLQSKNVVGQAFNFGTENPINVIDLVNLLIKISRKSNLKPVIMGKGKTKGEIDRQYLSIEKARTTLNWEPKFTLEEGLKETFLWYENFLG